jgi:hypothetical protein
VVWVASARRYIDRGGRIPNIILSTITDFSEGGKWLDTDDETRVK